MFSIVNFLITKRHILKEFSLKLLFYLLCHHIELSCPPPYDTPVSAASIMFLCMSSCLAQILMILKSSSVLQVQVQTIFPRSRECHTVHFHCVWLSVLSLERSIQRNKAGSSLGPSQLCSEWLLLGEGFQSDKHGGEWLLGGGRSTSCYVHWDQISWHTRQSLCCQGNMVVIGGLWLSFLGEQKACSRHHYTEKATQQITGKSQSLSFREDKTSRELMSLYSISYIQCHIVNVIIQSHIFNGPVSQTNPKTYTSPICSVEALQIQTVLVLGNYMHKASVP